MKKTFFVVLIAGLVVVWLQVSGFSAESGILGIANRLDDLLANQEKILAALAEIKKELYIIKVRAS